MKRTLGVLLACLALSLGASGCFNPFRPRIATSVGISEPKPSPATATGVIELLQWCYRHRAFAEYRELFADDYEFTFSSLDEAGNPYRDKKWRREDELGYAEHLFITGTAAEEPATSITLDYGNALVPLPDTRPGMNDRFHKQVNVGVVLVVRRPSSTLEVKGEARFFVVRGDVAVIPAELNLPADSLRWYIQGWEDNTVSQGQGARARPVTGATAAISDAGRSNLLWPTYPVTFGALRVLYRGQP